MPAIPVLITIRSSAHRDQDAEDETISMLTSGQLELEDTRAVIRYEETLDESLPAQQVVMTINEEGATMSRGGEYATDMVFRMGCRYEGSYHTPYGDMELAVYCTRALRSGRGRGRGTAELPAGFERFFRRHARFGNAAYPPGR